MTAYTSLSSFYKNFGTLKSVGEMTAMTSGFLYEKYFSNTLVLELNA